jgi:hypothetical protein
MFGFQWNGNVGGQKIRFGSPTQYELEPHRWLAATNESASYFQHLADRLNRNSFVQLGLKAWYIPILYGIMPSDSGRSSCFWPALMHPAMLSADAPNHAHRTAKSWVVGLSTLCPALVPYKFLAQKKCCPTIRLHQFGKPDKSTEAC